MTLFTQVSRRLIITGAAAAMLGSLAGPLVRPALAHEAKCPVCKLDVPQDTDEQDNEVAIRSGRKRIEYRCVFCAVQDAKSYTGEISVLAPSDVKGKPVLLSRKDDKWSVQPETAVFVATKVPHRQCQVGYRAFTSKAAFEAYAKKHADVVGADAKPLTVAQFVEVAAGK